MIHEDRVRVRICNHCGYKETKLVEAINSDMFDNNKPTKFVDVPQHVFIDHVDVCADCKKSYRQLMKVIKSWGIR